MNRATPLSKWRRLIHTRISFSAALEMQNGWRGPLFQPTSSLCWESAWLLDAVSWLKKTTPAKIKLWSSAIPPGNETLGLDPMLLGDNWR